MGPDRFRIIFRQLSKQEEQDLIVECRVIQQEAEEIAELRRLVFEATEPHQTFYTTT